MRALDARREQMEAADNSKGQPLERELRMIDDRLRVVFIEPRAGELHPRERGPGVIPGRWHMKLLTRPQNAYFPICGEDWVYRDPDLALVEEMKKRDLHRAGALEKIRNAEDDLERSRIRAELTQSEQRVDEVALAYRAAKRVRGDGGEHRRTDLGHAPHIPYAGGVSFPKTSDSGLVLPAGGSS